MLDAAQILKTNTKYYEENTKYKKAFEEYTRLNNLIINKRGKIQKDDYDITNTVGSVNARFKNSTVRFNKPKYELYQVLRTEVDTDILATKYEYNKLKKQLLYDSSLNEQNEVMQQIETMTTRLNEMYELRDVLISVYLSSKEKAKMQIDEIETKIQGERIKHATEFSEIENVRDNLQDSIRLQTLIQDYVKQTSNKVIMQLVSQKKQIEDYYNLISDVVLKLPSMEGSSSRVEDATKKRSPKKKDPKLSKIDKKAKQILKAKQTQEFDSKTYKKKMTKFLFNTMEECTNSKRSKEYYMSREQILDVINKDPTLQKKMGNIYKSLSKKDLCLKILEASKVPDVPNANNGE